MGETTETRYRQYYAIAKKITKGDERTQDLLHDVLLQLSANKKWNEINNKQEELYFITRALSNQYNSNNSQFQRTYRRFNFDQIEGIEQMETEYMERPTIEWINETLDEEIKSSPESWYRVGLFKMYMEHKKIEPLHKKTRIPKYSIRATIKEMKQWIKKQWEEQQNG